MTARIGAYEVLFELGQGGMGAVYLARALGAPAGAAGFERLVAIKRLHLHLTGRVESVERFLDEANVAARIHHANVVGTHQVGSDAAGHFLVQDYVEGDTLQGLVDHATIRRKRLPPPVVLRIALDALAGLHAVHEARDADGAPLGILHRDVSAQNLLVGRDGLTRLADFGIAKHALRQTVTDGHYLQGRVLYMPPEYLAREPVDRRFDVYGMGVTLFVALTGDIPWPGASEAQIVREATVTGVPSLSAAGLAIAPSIEAVVARACEKDPRARFATAQEMLDAIEEIGRHTGWIASHGEVATLVEELAGRELALRRAAIARVRGDGRAASTPEITAVSITRGGGGRRAPARLAAFAALGGAGMLGALALAVATRRSPDPRAGPASAPAPVAASASASASSAPSTPPSASPASTSLPSAAAPASASAPTARAAPRSGPAPSHRPSPAAPGAPLPIQTANPYR